MQVEPRGAEVSEPDVQVEPAAVSDVVESVSVSEPVGEDLAGGVATVGRVAPDQAARGTLSVAETLWDTDWFAAELSAGQAYVVEVFGVDGTDCTLRAPIVEAVHNTDGTEMAGTRWDDQSRKLYEKLTFTPTIGGTHFISVVGQAGDIGLGTYVVALTTAGEGSASRVDTIADEGCAPAAVTGLGTSTVTHGRVTLSWAASGHSAVTGYRIYRGTDARSSERFSTACPALIAACGCAVTCGFGGCRTSALCM